MRRGTPGGRCDLAECPDSMSPLHQHPSPMCDGFAEKQAGPPVRHKELQGAGCSRAACGEQQAWTGGQRGSSHCRIFPYR